MVKSRVLEERLIKIYKSGEGFFWIGGPGQEAFDVCLGLQLKKGRGNQFDWFHGHYRSTPVLVAMGMEMIEGVRMMKNLATDRSSHGRNFCNHYGFPEWNVAPISSPIEVQYSIAIGTAWAQRAEKTQGITVVTGGDAGTAEGDFASCLVWSSRPGSELPLLILVEEPSKGTNWARFPDTVKVGVAFFKLPKPYRRILNNALGHAFYNERLRYQREQARNQWKNGWIYRHGQSIIATLVLLVALGTGAYLLWSNFDSINFSLPEREPTFAEGFFDKVIKTNPKQKRDK